MSRRVDHVTEAELSILEVLWETGETTVRKLVERLYPNGGPSAAPTVQKLVERLEAKGHVERDRSGPVVKVRPRVNRAELISRSLKKLANELGDGSLSSLLTNLVPEQDIAPAEIQALRELVEGWDRAPGRCKKNKGKT